MLARGAPAIDALFETPIVDREVERTTPPQTELHQRVHFRVQKRAVLARMLLCFELSAWHAVGLLDVVRIYIDTEAGTTWNADDAVLAFQR